MIFSPFFDTIDFRFSPLLLLLPRLFRRHYCDLLAAIISPLRRHADADAILRRHFRDDHYAIATLFSFSPITCHV
jgi:hypothetical protein